MKCPNCNHEFIPENEDYPSCEVQGCNNPAELQGWYRALDFAGIPTGVIQLRMVCSDHARLLIGKLPEGTNPDEG